MSCSNVAMHICRGRDIAGNCSPRIGLSLLKHECLQKGSIAGKARVTPQKHRSYPSLSSFNFKNIKFNHVFQPFSVLCSFRRIRGKAAPALGIHPFLCLSWKEMFQIPRKPANSGARTGATLQMLRCSALRPRSFARH